jgi:hypothetical protein
MTSSLKSSISKRQKSLHKYWRNSQAYGFWAIKFNGMLKWHVESTMQIPCKSWKLQILPDGGKRLNPQGASLLGNLGYINYFLK